jgi:histidinol-phosphatase (PHP family)
MTETETSNKPSRPKLADYHMHTARCGHASGTMRDYVERALELSLCEIGFADHLPLLTGYDPSVTMSMEDLEDYVGEVEMLRSEYKGMTIKLGIEADYLPGYEDETARLLAAYDFDYVLGSIHFIDGWGFDDSRYLDGYKKLGIDEVYRGYYRLVAEAVSTGLFDIVGHLDLVKKYNFKPEGISASFAADAIKKIANAGMSIELNTAGLRKPVGEIYPTLDILKMCHETGVSITFGSDAHAPDEVGMDFDRALELAISAGYQEYAVFNKRKQDFVKFNPSY